MPAKKPRKLEEKKGTKSKKSSSTASDNMTITTCDKCRHVYTEEEAEVWID